MCYLLFGNDTVDALRVYSFNRLSQYLVYATTYLLGTLRKVKSNSGHIYLLALVLKVCRTPGPTVCLYKHAAGYRQHTINSDAGSSHPLAAGMTA